MLRKSITALVILIMLSLILGPIGSAKAQEPPQPTEVLYEFLFPQGKFPLGEDQLGRGNFFLDQAKSDPSAQTLTLGTVGLNFSYVQTFGVTEIPYIADTDHLNFPWGIATDGTNILIGEYWGHRLLKYTNTGAHVSTIGTAGTAYNNGEPWAIFDMAVDGSGQTWIVDNNGRVIKFDAANNYLIDFHNDGTFAAPAVLHLMARAMCTLAMVPHFGPTILAISRFWSLTVLEICSARLELQV
ncbi:MAG: hypothetical protein IPP99_05880 [Chitinophagaceae bacterium]|nr:hypothetical protein [Chitinophagaceae bacterium]